MAAVVETRVYYGAVPTEAVAANVRFKLADNNVQDVNDPCVIPDAGSLYSYWKTGALYCTLAPLTAINNVKLYSDGSSGWSGCTLWVGDQMTGTYDQATGSGDSGDEMTNHSQITTKTDLFSFTSDSPMSITGSIGYTTGRITNFVVLQVEITSAASGGHPPFETLTWRYDET